MAPKKRKTDASAPAAKKSRSNSSKPEKPRTAKAADLADITELAKKALEEIGDGDKKAADVAQKINEILGRQEKRQFNHTSLTGFLAPSRFGKALGVGARKDTYEYAGLSNPQLLSASADGIAFVVERDAKGKPTKIRDLVETYFDERNKQGVPFRSECFAVADNGDNVELTREAARASGLAKLGLRTYRLKPRHPDLMDDIEAADEDLHEKVKTARAALLARREHERVPYGTGDCKGPRPGLMRIRNRVSDGTQYVSFNVEPLKSEGLTYVIRPGTAPCGNQVQGAPPSTRRLPTQATRKRTSTRRGRSRAWRLERSAPGSARWTGPPSSSRLRKI